MHPSNQAEAFQRLRDEVHEAVNELLALTERLLETSLTRTQRTHVHLLRETADRLLTVGIDTGEMAGTNAPREYGYVEMDIRDTIAQVADVARALCADRQVEVTAVVPRTNLQYVVGDRNYVQQGLLSLVKVCSEVDGISSLRLSAEPVSAQEIRYSVQATGETDLMKASGPDTRVAERYVQTVAQEWQTDGFLMSFSSAVQGTL